MSILTWNDQLLVGYRSIDNQHKHLVELINELDSAIAIGDNSKSIIEIVNELVNYTVYHFQHEEKLMQEASYNAELMTSHKAEHKGFVDQMILVQQTVQKDSTTVTSQLMDYLINWLCDHILKVDKQLAISLNRGVDGKNVTIDQKEQVDIMQSNLYSALRESEDRFKELSDHIPALIWITNAQNNPVFCNHYWHKTFHLKPGEITQIDWLDTIHPEDRDKVEEAYKKAATEKVKIKVQYRLKQQDGRVFWFMETAVPRIRKNGSFAGLMGCGMDISSQKQAEEILAKSNLFLEEQVNLRTLELSLTNKTLEIEKSHQIELNKQLKEAQGHLIQSEKMVSLGQLAAGVAHEINNPLGYINSNLNSLKQYLQNLLSLTELAENLTAELPPNNSTVLAFNNLKKEIDYDFLKDDAKDLVNESIEGATRAKKIVQDLRDFSRIDKQEYDSFDLEAGLNATLNIVSNELKYKADIIKEYAGLKPFECVGAQLNQVFMNLLVNAAHAIEDFGKIYVRTGYKNENWLWVEIEDTGKGIPDEIRSKIFDPFFTTKPVGSGTGLGLSLSYKIIQDHHGEVDITSEVGKGTKFRMYLPINPVL